MGLEGEVGTEEEGQMGMGGERVLVVIKVECCCSLFVASSQQGGSIGGGRREDGEEECKQGVEALLEIAFAAATEVFGVLGHKVCIVGGVGQGSGCAVAGVLVCSAVGGAQILRKAATMATTPGVCRPKNSRNKKSRTTFEILFLKFSADFFLFDFLFVFLSLHTPGVVLRLSPNSAEFLGTEGILVFIQSLCIFLKIRVYVRGWEGGWVGVRVGC